VTRLRRPKIETFTIFEAGSNQIFLELGPRYLQPQDDTTVLRVGHKTVDPGGISVLLERGSAFEQLHYAVNYGVPWFLADMQTKAEFRPAKISMGSSLAIWWNGSGRTRTFTFSQGQCEDLAQWLADRIDYGWTGWKSGVTQ
jgi:hypothetical protein